MAMQSTAGDVLFFIPDIGGFTKFVAETEIRHSQHIIQELLELLVDANTLGLEVAEFEGDAVLFFRSGAPPSLDALVAQAKRMFIAFHAQLKRIEHYRVCQCGACVGASRVTLKIVAHAGSVSKMQVKSHHKFIGKDVIVAHRLLKNSVPELEYLLVTQDTLDRLVAPSDTALASFERGADTYDELGSIAYRYKSLSSYLAEVDIEPSTPYSLVNPIKVMALSRRIDAPAERIYARLIDLPARMSWIEGVRAVEQRDDRPNHVGKVHRCVRDDNDLELVTSDAKVGATTMELWETDVKKMAACRFLLSRAGVGATDVAIEFFVRRNPFVRLMFKALMQRKVKAGFEKSLANLAAVCEGAPR